MIEIAIMALSFSVCFIIGLAIGIKILNKSKDFTFVIINSENNLIKDGNDIVYFKSFYYAERFKAENKIEGKVFQLLKK